MTFESLFEEATSSAKLIRGSPDADVAIVSLWTKAKDIAAKLHSDQYAVIGQLFSAERGLDLLVRNLLANPQIKRIVVTGVDFSKSGIVLLDFFQKGFTEGHIDATDTDVWKVNSEFDGFIAKDIPKEALETLRETITITRVPNIATFDFDSFAAPTKIREKQPFPKEIVKTKHFVGEYTGHRVEGKTVAEAWLNVLDTILKFGKVSGTHYGTQQKEVLNLLSIITEEDPNNFFVPGYLPCNEQSIKEYIPRITQDTPGGISKNDYTYGSRMRSWFGTDQVKRAVAKLVRQPVSRAVVVGLWDATKDLEIGGSPCLNHLWLRISENKLHMTAIFRSHDMFEGYPENAFGLRALQEHIRQEWCAQKPGESLDLGPLMILSQSAHLYEDTWEWATKVTTKNLPPYRAHMTRVDPRGNFIISTDPETKQIVLEHTTPKKITLGVYWAKSAAEMRDILARENIVSLLGHAIDLGIELEKAELSLKLGIPYIQDQPLKTET
ncbi:MAG: thymidylate synthase [Nanoarchaeota archaeon]|nr:thymidylate synthase [Nanoarchaeota archaeon]